MELTEVRDELSGNAKKQIVTAVTNNIIKTYVSDETTKELLLTISNSMLNEVIDLVIDASKGKLNINQFKRSFSAKFCACFSKKRNTHTRI